MADRYTTANMVHQAGKIENAEEREKFLNWLWDLEFNLYGIPIPDKTFFLNMPPEYALKLIQNRENKFTHDTKKDIHERDEDHITDAYHAACSLVEKYDWCQVDCIKEESIRTVEDIHEEIFNEIRKYI